MKYFKQLVIVFALTMQSSVVLADGETPVTLSPTDPPVINGNPKPSKAPAKHKKPNICAYMDEANKNIILYSPLDITATYYIYNEDGNEVNCGIISFIGDGHDVINNANLPFGEYTIFVTLNGVTYAGTFII